MWVQIAFQKQEVKALFNTVPYNSFPASSELLQKLDAVAKAIDDMPTYTSDDRAFLNKWEVDLPILQEDVNELETLKANQITIAPTFSAETAYDIGDIVYYNGLTYRCTNAHEGEWDASDFAATTINNELASLNSKITSNDLGSAVDLSTYTTTDNLYTCQSDGYILLDATTSASTWINAEIYGSTSNNALVISASDGRNGIFVRKGMRVRKSGGDGIPYIYFYPLQ